MLPERPTVILPGTSPAAATTVRRWSALGALLNRTVVSIEVNEPDDPSALDAGMACDLALAFDDGSKLSISLNEWDFEYWLLDIELTGGTESDA